MGLTKVDESISVIKYLIKNKRRRLDDMSKRLEVSEKQKIFIGEEADFIRNVEVLIKTFTQEVNKNLGKLPPQDLEMEQAVLGALLFEKHAYDQVKSFLKPEHFHSEAHTLIYKAVAELAGTPVDLLTVKNKLRASGHIEQIGGAAYIAELVMKVSTGANVEIHARNLVEKAIKRELILLSGQTIGECYDDSTDTFMVLQRLENGLKELNSWIKQ